MVVDSNQFQGKTYLVIGGTSGIGLGICKRLVANGAFVLCAGRDTEKAKICLTNNTTFFAVDCSDPSQIRDMIRSCPVLNGGLVYSVGFLGKLALFYQLADKDFADQLQSGPVAFNTLMIELVKNRKIINGSSVVVVSAIAELITPICTAPYSAAKAALSTLARSFAADLAERKKGVRVNIVDYGYVHTPLTKSISAAHQSNSTLLPIPEADSEAVSGPVLFLLSNMSRWISGETLVVDGGTSMKAGKQVI